MSSPIDPDDDLLVRALRALPRPAMDASEEARTRAAARFAYARAGDEPHAIVRLLAPLAVPTALACVCGLYLLWAFSTAAALTR